MSGFFLFFALFFLDSFQLQKQKAELSSWIRGRVKPFRVFDDALREFREFVAQASSNPLLIVRNTSK